MVGQGRGERAAGARSGERASANEDQRRQVLVSRRLRCCG